MRPLRPSDAPVGPCSALQVQVSHCHLDPPGFSRRLTSPNLIAPRPPLARRLALTTDASSPGSLPGPPAPRRANRWGAHRVDCVPQHTSTTSSSSARLPLRALGTSTTWATTDLIDEGGPSTKAPRGLVFLRAELGPVDRIPGGEIRADRRAEWGGLCRTSFPGRLAPCSTFPERDRRLKIPKTPLSHPIGAHPGQPPSDPVH